MCACMTESEREKKRVGNFSLCRAEFCAVLVFYNVIQKNS